VTVGFVAYVDMGNVDEENVENWDGPDTPSLSDTTGFSYTTPGTFFVDCNGGLWFGYTLYDTNSADSTSTPETYGNAVTGYLGLLVSNIYSIPTTSFGSLISASLSALFFLIAAIFAF